MKICLQIYLLTRKASVDATFKPSEFIILHGALSNSIQSDKKLLWDSILISTWILITLFDVVLCMHGGDSAEGICYWNMSPFHVYHFEWLIWE